MTLLRWLVLAPLAAASVAVAQEVGQPPSCPERSALLVAQPQATAIRWKGTKFFGLGSHEGTVQLQSGHLCVLGTRISGGRFVVDMRTIEVTDIPVSDPVPRSRLRDHLLSEDFFSVRQHPIAILHVDSVWRENASLHRLAGRLTIRGITHPVVFYLRVWQLSEQSARAQARFSIDRHQWGVRYRGSTLRDDLVDDEFTLDITIEALKAG